MITQAHFFPLRTLLRRSLDGRVGECWCFARLAGSHLRLAGAATEGSTMKDCARPQRRLLGKLAMTAFPSHPIFFTPASSFFVAMVRDSRLTG